MTGELYTTQRSYYELPCVACHTLRYILEIKWRVLVSSKIESDLRATQGDHQPTAGRTLGGSPVLFIRC